MTAGVLLVVKRGRTQKLWTLLGDLATSLAFPEDGVLSCCGRASGAPPGPVPRTTRGRVCSTAWAGSTATCV